MVRRTGRDSSCIASVTVHTLVAPPRLLPARFGIIDTLVAPDGSGHFDSTLINSAGDKYASMPSLHVACAVWCALALYPVARGTGRCARWRSRIPW
jgi:PAP2 superfamily